ncbi:MAG: cell division protein FtsZ [Gammaproteobacteria bacterium]|nr:cell division protein FtsZ [Gammaproteobacteria bacterium]
MSFELIDTNEQKADIKVVGVGGCGNNAIEYMIVNKVTGVDFICVNTDAQDLKNNPVNDNRKCNIGHNITRGLGAGADPEIGRQAAIEDRDKLKESIENCDMLFITAGMGGGTGTGASPVIAELAKELGILTVAVVTKPWEYEKKKRMLNAEKGIDELRSKVDSLIIIPNDKLCIDDDMPLSEAKNQSNAVLERAVGGIAELITKPGEINLDFADVKSVMSNAGSTMMGSGIGEGIDRAEDAIQEAIASPLLEDVDVRDAKGLLINITSNGSLTNGEFKAIGDHIGSLVDEEEADVIVGTTIDELLEDKIKITVVATGMKNSYSENNAKQEVDIMLDPISNKINSEENFMSQSQELDKEEVLNTEPIFENLGQEQELFNASKQEIYEINNNTEEKLANKIKSESNIKYKKDSNGELDLDFLDIPAFLRKQAD